MMFYNSDKDLGIDENDFGKTSRKTANNFVLWVVSVICLMLFAGLVTFGVSEMVSTMTNNANTPPVAYISIPPGSAGIAENQDVLPDGGKDDAGDADWSGDWAEMGEIDESNIGADETIGVEAGSNVCRKALPEVDCFIEYMVVSGDRLSRIAVKFGVSVDSIAQRNRLFDKNMIRTGSTLIIPCPFCEAGYMPVGYKQACLREVSCLGGVLSGCQREIAENCG